MTSMKPLLLIVDDDDAIRAQIRWALASEYDVVQAEDRPSALECFRASKPPVVLLDLGLPPRPGTPEEGLATLSALLEEDGRTKVVILSGQSEKNVALRAVGGGAYDFLSKPVEMDELKPLLRRCFHVARLEREYLQLQQQWNDGAFEGILGSSRRMQVVFDFIRKVATTDAPVLLLGESGTGKEMVARAIHLRSGRKAGPFVAINCSAIPETLLESELFGHEKGSFTGAHTQRKGRIESAEGGTLFLDEIGEVPLSIQVKLLRFLQEQSIERVGGREEIPVNARILAATNADLAKAMADGTFREDLFYRLAVVQIVLPPLRDRDNDLALLAESFLQRYAAESGRSGLALAKDALKAIQRHPWPGNVRELQNRIRRAVVMSGSRRISAEDLDLASGVAPSTGLSLKEARENVDREMVEQALRRHGGKIAPAATELGVSRPTMYDLMNRLGVAKADNAD